MDGLDQLRLEAFTALSGADFVRQRLLHGFSMGSPSLESEAYMIKSRVKAADSLVTKVLERREEKPLYRASDVRDIIGLRILSLFRNDLPILVRRFLYFIEWSQRDPFSLFYGTGLDESIEEIKIYPTSDMTDPYVGLCIGEFATFGFFEKSDPRYAGGVPVIIDRKDSRYSSIHIVLWANGANTNVGERVPVEVQLRTSIEDVWGEIDHRLRYKTRQKKKEDFSSQTQDVIIDIESDVSSYLKTLKKSLDTSSEMADIIETRMKSIDFERHPLQSNRNNISIGIGALLQAPIPKKIERDVRSTVEALKGCYSQVQSLESPPSKASIRSIASIFERCQSDLIKYYDVVCADDSVEIGWLDRVSYFLLMERALCLYWMASLNRSLQSSSDSQAREAKTVEHIRTALSLYQRVAAIDGYAADPVLSFRIATALDLKGDTELAQSKYREAVMLLEGSSDLPAGHYFRNRIPMQYAISLWQSAENMRRKASEYGGLTFVNRARQDLYREAILVTKPLISFEVTPDEQDSWPVDILDQNINAKNNVLDYAIAFLRAGGPEEELASHGLGRKFLKECLDSLVGEGVSQIDKVTVADTVRAAAKFLENDELRRSAANRVLELIDNKDFTVVLPDVAYQEMKLDAMRDRG